MTNDNSYGPVDFRSDIYMGPAMSRGHRTHHRVRHQRTNSKSQNAPAVTEPLISGGEPGWGKNIDAKQRREAGFDDVRVAQKHNRNPNTPIGPSAQTSPKTPTSPSALTPGGVPGYTFNLTTMRYNGGFAHTLSEPFGVYFTLQECNAVRATKIAELGHLRFLHQDPDAPTMTHRSPLGRETTSQARGFRRMDVTECGAGTYSPNRLPNPQIVPAPPEPSLKPSPKGRDI
jgi:hypothetical protein